MSARILQDVYRALFSIPGPESCSKSIIAFFSLNSPVSLPQPVFLPEFFDRSAQSHGAERERIGRFEAAQGGTIFLDEVGDISLSTQVKLLRVLEDKKIERVGDQNPISVNVRVITATNKILEELVAEEVFREELFFRINVFPLQCPSLAERSEDIPLIVQNFIKRYGPKEGNKILGCTPEVMEKLVSYPWPGNVRELRNAIEYAFVLCPSGAIGVQHLPPKIAIAHGTSIAEDNGKDPAFIKERESLLQILKQTKGNQSEEARLLGVSRVTIWKRIKKYNIDLTPALYKT